MAYVHCERHGPMTRARFTAAELRDAAKVATEARVVIRLERGEAAAEVKPVDLDKDKAQPTDGPEPW